MMPKSIGQWIRDARTKGDLTQQQLADKLGGWQPQVCNWENDVVQPDREVIERISAITGVEIPSSILGVGEWVQRRREELEMSRDELAKKAGISPLTIYFIEKGQTRSPQETTLKGLQKVLGKLPEVIDHEVGEVRGEEDFEFLGPFPIVEWEQSIGEGRISCIYVIYDSLKRPVRIGETDDLGRRMKEYSLNVYWFRQPTAMTFAYIKVSDPDFRKKAEKVMIKLVGDHAIFNTQERI